MPVIPKTGNNVNVQTKMSSSKQSGKEKRHRTAALHPSPSKTKVKGHSEVKDSAKSAESPKSASPKKGKLGSPSSKSLAKKSKALDSKPKSAPKGSANPIKEQSKSAGTKEHTKSAGRHHLKTATSHSKSPSKTTSKSVQKGATPADISAGLAIAYGSAHRAKSIGQNGLLTARYHRSSGSPGEAVTPPYGDVRTMVCDVSPVPSDVESIDYSNSKSKTPATDKRGLFGRSQQTLRVGHPDRKSSHSAAKGRNLNSHSEDTAKVNTITKSEESGEHGVTQPIPETDKSIFKNDKIAVRIVPDSAKHKSEKEITKTTPHIKAHNNETNKQQKGITKPSLPQPPKMSNTKLSQPINKPLKGGKLTKVEKVSTNNDNKAKVTTETGLTKKETTCEHQPDVNKENAATGPNPDDVSTEQTENDVKITFEDTDEANLDKDNLEENLSITPSSICIPADEECRKAYAILNRRGIKVSLHTLRRALLTPTEYRLLQSASQN